jgi:hypothetical protein
MKKNFYFFGVLLFLVTINSGCATTATKPPLYVWGNYQYTSTAYGMFGEKKEVLAKHTQELEKIIGESNANNQRVAPGIYAEYGQLLYENNKKMEAKKYLLLEKSTYPESTRFIDLVLVKLYGDKI